MEDHLDQITFQKARSSACLARGQRDKHELTTKLCQNDFGSRSTFYENINCIKALLQMSLKFIFLDACNFSQRNQSCEKMILLSQVFSYLFLTLKSLYIRALYRHSCGLSTALTKVIYPKYSKVNTDYLLWHAHLIVCAEKYYIMV